MSEGPVKKLTSDCRSKNRRGSASEVEERFSGKAKIRAGEMRLERLGIELAVIFA